MPGLWPGILFLRGGSAGAKRGREIEGYPVIPIGRNDIVPTRGNG
jgi:hypothetical protein